jgi:hypothetical protein
MDTNNEQRHQEFIAKLRQLPPEEITYWRELIQHSRDLYLSGRGGEIEEYIKYKYREKTGRIYGGLHGSA